MTKHELVWDDLRYLEACERLRSLPAAARELGVAVSTAYRRLEALERAVGSPCLVRGGRGFELTETGEALARLARRTRDELGQARSAARLRKERIAGSVSLTTVDGFLPLLAEPLAALARRHPDLTVELLLGDRGPSVRRREVDVAIGVMPRPPRGLVGRRLLRIGYGVFGRPEVVERAPRRWVVTGPPIHNEPEARWERAHADSIAVVTGSRLAMMELLRCGAGVGLAPRPLAALHDDLVEIPSLADEARSLGRDAWLLVHPDMRDDARVRALSDALAPLSRASGGLLRFAKG